MFPIRLLCALGACAAVVTTTACGAKKPAAAPPPNVATTVASVATIKPASSMPGLIAPYENVAIQSTLSEPADEVYVQEGDVVHRGQVLAQLDTADLQAQLASDIATMNADRANTVHTQFSGSETITQGDQSLKSAQANAYRDNAILARDQKLFDQGYISLQQLQADQATARNDQSVLQSAQAAVSANGSSLSAPGLQSSSVDQAKAQEQIAEANAQQIRVQISKAAIVSPIDGVVVNRNLNPGEYPGTRQIFTLQQVSPIYAILRGSSGQIAGIGNGAIAQVSTDEGERRKYSGPVTGVLNEIQPGSTQFQIKVLLQNSDRWLRPGMAIQGSVTLPGVTGVRVPTTAFTDDNHNAVQVVEPDDTVKTINAVEVASDGTNSIVTGVPSGSRVIVNGQSSIGDGEKVSLQP